MLSCSRSDTPKHSRHQSHQKEDPFETWTSSASDRFKPQQIIQTVGLTSPAYPLAGVEPMSGFQVLNDISIRSRPKAKRSRYSFTPYDKAGRSQARSVPSKSSSLLPVMVEHSYASFKSKCDMPNVKSIRQNKISSLPSKDEKNKASRPLLAAETRFKLGLTETSNETHLSSHIATIHRKTERCFCAFCGKGYTRASYLEAHIIKFHLKKTVLCYFCEDSFKTSLLLKVHIRMKHSFVKQEDFQTLSELSKGDLSRGEYWVPAVSQDGEEAWVSSESRCSRSEIYIRSR